MVVANGQTKIYFFVTKEMVLFQLKFGVIHWQDIFFIIGHKFLPICYFRAISNIKHKPNVTNTNIDVTLRKLNCTLQAIYHMIIENPYAFYSYNYSVVKIYNIYNSYHNQSNHIYNNQ